MLSSSALLRLRFHYLRIVGTGYSKYLLTHHNTVEPNITTVRTRTAIFVFFVDKKLFPVRLSPTPRGFSGRMFWG
ncbi:MAG: hypothetical protein WCF14_10255 [Nitrososphaeraceae archaeon]